jgi:peptide/nickel transport system ATP-binding protein
VGLLRSFPALHGECVRLDGIAGSPPSLKDLPSGCPFHPRCPHAMPRCRIEMPALVREGGDEQTRSVACWLHDRAGVAS